MLRQSHTLFIEVQCALKWHMPVLQCGYRRFELLKSLFKRYCFHAMNLLNTACGQPPTDLFLLDFCVYVTIRYLDGQVVAGLHVLDAGDNLLVGVAARNGIDRKSTRL